MLVDLPELDRSTPRVAQPNVVHAHGHHTRRRRMSRPRCKAACPGPTSPVPPAVRRLLNLLRTRAWGRRAYSAQGLTCEKKKYAQGATHKFQTQTKGYGPTVNHLKS
jgi:hypothetical protein